jgi:hypothetical protein
MNLIEALEASFNIVFSLFGIGRNAPPSETVINELGRDRLQSITILNKLSGKALTVEDSSANQGARVVQLPRSDAEQSNMGIRAG